MRGLKIPKGFEDSTLEEIKTEGANVPAGFEDSVLEEITDTSKKKVGTSPASSNGLSPIQPTSGSGVSQSPAYSVKVDEGPMRKGQPSTVTVGGKEFEVAPSPELTSTEVKSTANKLFKIASPITSAAPKIPQSPVMEGVVKPTEEAAISNLSPKAASGNEDVLTEYISTLNEADQNRLRGSKMNDEQSFEILTKAYAPRLEQAVIDLSILRDRGVEDDLKAIDDSQKQMQTLTQTISADKTALVDLQATFLKQKGYDKISSEYKNINRQLQVKQTELAPLFKEQQQLEATLKQFEPLIQDGNFVGNEQEYNAYQETYKAYEQLTQSPDLANYNNLVKKQNEIASNINSMVTPEYKAQEEKLLGKINTTVASANTLMQNSQGLLTPEKIENIELYKQTVEEYNSITNKLQTAKSKMPDVIEKEAYINAMNAAVKDNPYLKAFDLSAKAIGGFTEAVGSLLSAVPSFTGGMSNEYTFSDKVSESITNFFAPSITNTQTTTAGRPSAAYQPFYDSEIDHINWSSLPDEIANQAGAFAVLAGSGVLGGMAKFSEISSVVVPGALISYNDAYKTGREIYGDDAFSATAYATASSLITGITELIMPDRDILTGGSVDKIAKNYVVNYAKKGKRFAIERSLLDLTEMMGKEVTEEFADRWKDVLLKGVVNMTGGDIENDIPTLNEQLSIAASTAALTGGVGAFSQRGKNSKARQLAVYQSAKSYPETITMLNTMEQEGYDADRIDAIKSEVTNMFVTLKEVPADLSAPKRIAIAEKLNTIKKIEDAMASGISPFIADRMNDSIKKISDDIQNIITDPNYDEVFGKEVNEEVAKSEEVIVPSEEEVVSEIPIGDIEAQKQEELENEISYIKYQKEQEVDGNEEWQRDSAKKFNANVRSGLLRIIEVKQEFLDEARERGDNDYIKSRESELQEAKGDLEKFDKISTKYDLLKSQAELTALKPPAQSAQNDIEAQKADIEKRKEELEKKYEETKERHLRELEKAGVDLGKWGIAFNDIIHNIEEENNSDNHSKEVEVLAREQYEEWWALNREKQEIESDANKLSFSDYNFSNKQSILDRLKKAISKVYQSNRQALDEGFAEWYTVEREVASVGGNQYSAHGMGKTSIASAFTDLINLFEKGINPFKGQGALDVATLAGGVSDGTTAGGAYMNGAFTLVANRNHNGRIENINQIGGIIVNEGIATTEVLSALKELFPNLVVESTLNSKSLIEQLNAKYDAELKALEQPTSNQPEIEAKKADIEKRRQEELSSTEYTKSRQDIEQAKKDLEREKSNVERASQPGNEGYLERAENAVAYHEEQISILTKINAKYDAELAAIETPAQSEAVKEDTTTQKADIEKRRQEDLETTKNIGEDKLKEGRENTKKIVESLKQRYPTTSVQGIIIRILEKLIDFNKYSTIIDSDYLSGRNASGQATWFGMIISQETLDGILAGKEHEVHTFIHEFIHGFTTSKISDYNIEKQGLVPGFKSKLTAKEKNAIEQLQRIFEKVKRDNPKSKEYGFTNLDEFIAEAFSSSGFQHTLKNTKAEGKKSNLFSEFINAIGDLLFEQLERWAKRFNKEIPQRDTITGILEDVLAWTEDLIDQNNKLAYIATNEEINAKYDAELAALGNEVKPTTDGKVNEEGSQELLASESEAAATIPEAPPLGVAEPTVVVSGESTTPVSADENFAGLEPDPQEVNTASEGEIKDRRTYKRYEKLSDVSGTTKAQIPEDAKKYLVQTNKMSIAEARAMIRDIGIEETDKLIRDLNNGINGAVRTMAATVLLKTYEERGMIDEHTNLTRWIILHLTDAGQTSQAAAMLEAIKPDYTLAGSEFEYEKATGEKLPEHLRKRFEVIGKEIAALEKKAQGIKDKLKEKALEDATVNIIDSVNRESKAPAKKKMQSLSAEKKSRKAELKKKYFGIFNDFTNIPRLLVDKEFLEYNKLILEEAAGDFKNFVKILIAELGSKTRPYAREFYKAAGGTELPELEKAYYDEEGKIKIPKEVIREIVMTNDIKKADELVAKVMEYVQKDFPEATATEVKESITEYGKTVNPSKDQIDAEIRRLKRDGKLELGLKDATEGKGVKRSGLQREKPTDYQRDLMRKINEELKRYPEDLASVEKKWASALDRVKTHLKNTIADTQKRIQDIKDGIAEPLPSKKRGFELDEEAKALQEERDNLKKILAELEPKQEMSDEARVKVALAAAERAIAATADKINAQEFEYKKKKEPLNAPELVAARERLKLGKDVLNRMREESGFAEQHRYDLWKKRLQKRITDLQEKIDNKDFSVAPKKVMEINQEVLELRVKADKLKFERDVEIEKARIKSLTGLQKAKQIALDVINLPKSLMASADLSAPLRQGALLTARHPIMGLAAAKEMMKQAFSQKAQDKWVAALHESEIYPYMKHSKLFLSEPSVDLSAKEEQFISNIAEKIPVWGRVVKGSGRAYNGYLNKLRADVFSQFFYALKQEGVTGAELETQLKSYAKFINNATGRGDLGIGETSALVLNSAFFSPRYVASRFNLLNPVFYAKLEPRTRLEALKTMGTYIGIVSMTLALLSAMGDDDDEFTVELDPRSSDFGKLKWGDTRFDLLAGFQQWVRMFAQIVTGQKKSTITGEIVTLGEGYKADTRLDVLRKFFISKAAPAAAAGMNILRGKDMMGEPITPEGELLKLAIPLYVSDMYEVYKEDGIGKSVATTLPAFFGVGVQTYGKGKKQPTTREEVQAEMDRRLEKEAKAEAMKEYRDNNPKIQEQKDKKEADEDALYERAKEFDIEYIKK